MTYEVRYFSRTGNTKKLADRIAAELGAEALGVNNALSDDVQILMLGAALYGGEIAVEMAEFINSLSAEKIKCVVVFSTSFGKNTPYNKISAMLHQKNIPVAKETFHTKGKFLFFSKGRPNEADLQAAADFAKQFK